VKGNDISETGNHAVSISGGDRKTLAPAENVADNNYIHHTGVFNKRGTGIWLEGVGNRASHNLIHDCPRIGIFFSGNNLTIEFNHIRHVNLETADTGGLYTGGRDWISSRGTLVRYNFIHDMLGYGWEGGRWVSPHFAWGIYLDDNAGGVDIVGNVIARAVLGLIHLHNGRDVRVENNILVDGDRQQILYSGWTAKDSYWIDHMPSMLEGYESVAGQPAWRAMRNMGIHPHQAVLPNGTIMSGNEVRRNIFYYRKTNSSLFKFSNVSLDHNASADNLAYHFGKPIKIEHTPVGQAKRGRPTAGWPNWWTAAGQDRRSLVGDPLFVDPDNDDYRLRPDSPAWKLGFQPIPVEKIGPYADPLRASWPIVEAEGAREKPSAALQSN